MSKLGGIILIIVGVVAAYLILIVIVPVIANFAASANATMDASSNMSLYPGTSGFLLSIPWILFFVPAAIGIILIIVTLRSPGEDYG